MAYDSLHKDNISEIIMALGENLRRLRVARGLTQGELSNMTGVKLGQISKIERNEADPKVSTIYKLMKALDCSADRMFLDEAQAGVSGVLKEAFEEASNLPEFDQITIIRVIEKFCSAHGLNTMLKEHRVLINASLKPAADQYPPYATEDRKTGE